MKIISVLRESQGLDDYMLLSAIRKEPHLSLINYDDRMWVEYRSEGIIQRTLRFLQRRSRRKSFTRDIYKKVQSFRPHLLIVFKGHNLDQRILPHILKEVDYSVLVYPDLDPLVHGKYYCDNLKLFSSVFFTKPNLESYFNEISPNFRLISPIYPSGNPLSISTVNPEIGVLFVGHFSRSKNIFLNELITLAEFKITIVGRGWHHFSNKQNVNVLNEVYGDAVNSLYQSAVFVLGLLQGPLSSGGQGDVVTSRSVLVPFNGGLLVHKDNHYSRRLLGDEPLMFFKTANDLVSLYKEIMLSGVREKLWKKQQENILANGKSSENLIKEICTL